MFERIPEPELMLDTVQAEQYAAADFEATHARHPREFRELYPRVDITGTILDIGCGPADVTVRFAKLFPKAHVIGVDGSAEMLRLAEQRIASDEDLSLVERVTFRQETLQHALLESSELEPAQLIIANGMLHHLHNPKDLWTAIQVWSQRGTLVFVTDLQRPKTEEDVLRIVRETTHSQHPIHVADYYNSLRAAFTPDEVRQQLVESGLDAFLEVEEPDDSRIIVHGSFPVGGC